MDIGMHISAGTADTVRLSLLGGGGAVDDDTLVRLYAYPDELTRPLVRGNMIASIDGAATTAGTSGGLGGPGDRRLFALQRELADVVVVGAGTARAESYGGVRLTAPQRQSRRERGQSEVPPIALVTRSGVLEHDLPVLTASEVTPLVLTCTAAADDTRSRLGSTAEVLDCSGADPGAVDLAVALRRLGDRGLRRILTEGGPSLLGAFIARQLLDELCLTSAPVLVGGTAVRIAAGATDVLSLMRRAHVLADDDGYLYSRYTRLG
jgi:riboflavin biosynthesis pyrimidine reductase